MHGGIGLPGHPHCPPFLCFCVDPSKLHIYFVPGSKLSQFKFALHCHCIALGCCMTVLLPFSFTFCPNFMLVWPSFQNLASCIALWCGMVVLLLSGHSSLISVFVDHLSSHPTFKILQVALHCVAGRLFLCLLLHFILILSQDDLSSIAHPSSCHPAFGNQHCLCTCIVSCGQSSQTIGMPKSGGQPLLVHGAQHTYNMPISRTY